MNTSPLKRHLFWLLLFTALSIGMTWPLVAKMSSNVIGKGSDAFYFYWYLDHFNTSVRNFESPGFTRKIFYPEGTVISNEGMMNCLIAIPLLQFLELKIVYNIIVLLSFILSGYGMAVLSYFLLRSFSGSIISGIIFAFSPFHFAHIDHLNIMSIQWIPFFVLFIIKLFTEDKKSNSVWAAVFFSLMTLSSWYFGLMGLLFGILLLAARLLRHKETVLNKKFSIRAGIFMLGAIFLLLGPLLHTAGQTTGTRVFRPGIDSSVNQSLDLLSFAIPPPGHILFGGAAGGYYDRVMKFGDLVIGSRAEMVGYLGFFCLLLVAGGLVSGSIKPKNFWVICGLFFFTLSLGPALKCLGLVRIPMSGGVFEKLMRLLSPGLRPEALALMKGHIGVPLPYLLFAFLPLFSFARAAARFSVFTVLSVALLCGISLKALREKYRGFFERRPLAGSLIAPMWAILILMDFMAAPLPVLQDTAEDSFPWTGGVRAAAVLDLPISAGLGDRYQESARYLFLQTLHRNPITGGLHPRADSAAYDFANLHFQALMPPRLGLISPEAYLKIRRVLLENNIGTIVIHKNFLELPELDAIRVFFAENNNAPAFENMELIVYKIS